MAGAGRLNELAEAVLARISAPEGPVLVALSGGADSAVCAWALAELGVDVTTCYVDHGWEASTELGEAAAAIAAQLGLTHHSVAVDIPAGASREGRAREARYSALAGTAESLGIELVAAGHTRDDQAETLLLQLSRGAGLDGMAGIWPTRGGVIRPLLDIGREETRELAASLGLKFFDDPTNYDTAIERNRVRRLMSELGDAGLAARLARSTGLVQTDLKLISSMADDVPITESSDRVGIPAPVATSLPLPVRRRLIRRALRKVRGPYAGTSAEVERTLRCLAGEAGPQELSSGVVVERSGPWLWFRRDVQPESSIQVAFEESTTAPAFFPTGAWRAVFDADVVAGAALRSAQESDTIEIADGHKSVADVLAEAGVGARRRKDWPVLAAGDRIAWVVGCRTAAWSWVGDATDRYLYASATNEDGK